MDEHLLVTSFLNSLFHKAQGFSNYFLREIKFDLLSLDPFVLFLNFLWEEIHHVVVLKNLLKVFVIYMFNESDFV